MGDNMVMVGDYVTRKSYNNDIIFKVIDIREDIFYLSGVSVRLYADSYEDDLIICEKSENEDDCEIKFDDYKLLDRNEYFYLPGKVLHIDGDNEFLEKSMKFYYKNKIKAYGIFSEESKLADNIVEYLNKYNPDILVITGHDAMYRKKRNEGTYKNTDNFVRAIKEARKFEKSHEKLLIVAGACQSNYEELIKAGANFASSPKRVNIHALDPAIVASSLSFSNKNMDIDLVKILEKTKYGIEGMGGIITKGTMYVGFPR